MISIHLVSTGNVPHLTAIQNLMYLSVGDCDRSSRGSCRYCNAGVLDRQSLNCQFLAYSTFNRFLFGESSALFKRQFRSDRSNGYDWLEQG